MLTDKLQINPRTGGLVFCDSGDLGTRRFFVAKANGDRLYFDIAEARAFSQDGPNPRNGSKTLRVVVHSKGWLVVAFDDTSLAVSHAELKALRQALGIEHLRQASLMFKR